jgi:transposase
MPSPIPVPIRRAIFRRWQHGQTVADIAPELNLPRRTVRHLIRRFRLSSGQALAPGYQRTARRPLAQEAVRRAALQLRQEHPRWGAGLIRLELPAMATRGTVPSERTLQRWFHQVGLGPAPKGRRPPRETRRAQRPHEVWQPDAKEQVRLRDGQRVSWLRITDEHSGAILWTKVFPPRVLGAGRGRCRATGNTPGLCPLGPTRAFPGG